MKKKLLATLLVSAMLCSALPFASVSAADHSNGWERTAQTRYWKNDNYATGWKKIDKKWYHFNSEGWLDTGWFSDYATGKEEWYYLATSDGHMYTGWNQIGGSKYYFDVNSGAMSTGWKTLGQSQYYFNGNGVMVTGWQNIGGKCYYFNQNGVMTIDYFKENKENPAGWVQTDSKWYYFEEDGVIATGWKNINGKCYYFNQNGVMTIDYFKENHTNPAGWLLTNGKWYYFAENGRLLVNTTTPDGYQVGSDGAMLSK